MNRVRKRLESDIEAFICKTADCASVIDFVYAKFSPR